MAVGADWLVSNETVILLIVGHLLVFKLSDDRPLLGAPVPDRKGEPGYRKHVLTDAAPPVRVR